MKKDETKDETPLATPNTFALIAVTEARRLGGRHESPYLSNNHGQFLVRPTGLET